MADKRIKDKSEIGRSLNDNDLIFVTKTNEDTDNPALFSRFKNDISTYITGLTQNIYTQGIDAGTNIYTGGTDTNPSVSLMDNIAVVSISADTIFSGSTNLYDIFLTSADGNDITRLQNGLNTYTGGTENEPTINISSATLYDLSVSGDASFNSITATTYYGNASGLTGVVGSEILEPIYLTYDGTSGTTSGTKGITLTSPGNWEITKFGCIYYIDDKDGDIEVTIPDAELSNEGKVFSFTKPRLVASNNSITLKTVSGQNIAQRSTFLLNMSDDVIQIVSCNFGANGGEEWKYRLTYRNINEPQVLRVSAEGSSLFSTIKSAVDYANDYVISPCVVLVEPGEYYISEPIYLHKEGLKILGRGSEITKIFATPSLSGNSIFNANSHNCDFENLTMSGSYQTYSAIRFSGTPYCEMHTIVVDSFERGICFNQPNTQIWLFDSIIKNNTIAGVCNLGGVSLGISEVTFENNNYGINFYTGDTQRHSVQNSIFLVNSGQTGIEWSTSGNTYEYAFFSNNAFYGDGTYINGIVYTDPMTFGVQLKGNVGVSDSISSIQYVGSGDTWTECTTRGVYYDLLHDIIEYTPIRFSASSNNIVYLGKNATNFNVQLQIIAQASAQPRSYTVGVFRNDNIKPEAYTSIRVTASNTDFPLPLFGGISNAQNGDIFKLKVACTSHAGTNFKLIDIFMNIKE